jgi:hypothetical protein
LLQIDAGAQDGWVTTRLDFLRNDRPLAAFTMSISPPLGALSRGHAQPPGGSTTDGTRTLDWFLTGPAITECASTKVLMDAPVAVHRPPTAPSPRAPRPQVPPTALACSRFFDVRMVCALVSR